MKRITLHRPAADNTGAFVDAGSDLLVGEANEPKTINADRALALIDSHGAIDPDPAPQPKAKTGAKPSEED